jgi:hypothetical protein
MKQPVTALLALALSLAGGAQARPLRDPFVRLAPPPSAAAAAEAAPQAAEAPPQLRAIMYAPRRSLANINGQILAVGEWFGDYQLIKVEERAVTLARRGVKSVLALDEASRK